jgi:hypothetical protein
MVSERFDFRLRTASGDIEIELNPSGAIDDVARAASLQELAKLVYDFRCREPQARHVLLSVFARLRGLPASAARAPAFDFDTGSPRVEAIGRHLETAARSGQLVLRRRVTRHVVALLPSEDDLVLGPEPEPTAWIAIELVDEDGAPVANADYRIECDDGRVRTGTTDASGKAREEGLHAGNCKVSFPRLDGQEWKKAG